MPVQSDLLDVRLAVAVGDAEEISLQVAGRTIIYDAATRKLDEAPLDPEDGTIHIQVLADRSLTETIGNHGRVYISGPGPARQGQDAAGISVTAEGGQASLLSLEAHELRSIWGGQ